MNTAIVNHHRSFSGAINTFLATGAVVLAVIAIVDDDVSSITPSPIATAPLTTIVGPAHPLGGVDLGIPCSELVFTRC